MKLATKVLLVSLLISAGAAGAFDVSSYWPPPLSGAAASVAVADDATSVPLNPAGLAAGHGFNGFFSSSVQPRGAKNFHSFFDTIVGGIGYDWMRARGENVRSSRFSWTYGAPVARWLGVGAGVNRLAASRPYATSAWTVDAGVLLRPSRYLSLGGVARNLNEPRFLRRLERRTYVAAVAVRPGWERLTLSCDAGLREGEAWRDVGYQLGVDVEVVAGVELSFGVDDERNFAGGVNLGFGFGGVGYDVRVSEEGEVTGDNASVYFNRERRAAAFDFGGRYAEFDISGKLAEEAPGFSLFGGGGTGVRDVLRGLRAARKDRRLRGVILRIGKVNAGFGPGVSALTQELRDEVKAVRRSGKKVYAYVEEVDRPAAYYIAAAADVIVMPRWGYFGGVGTYMTMWRLNELAERYGVEWDYVTAGKYKGAFHIVGAEDPSEEMKGEVQKIVDDTYARFVEDVAADRGLTPEKVRELCEGPAMFAEGCREVGLVDEVGRYEDLKTLIARADGKEEVALTDVSAHKRWRRRWGRPRAVRVVYVVGGIETGKSGRSLLTGRRTVGADTVVRDLREAREDGDVGAIVLRIDSGGGSGLASDDIYEEVLKCRAAGKVVVASMGDLAASGGYYVAAGAAKIYAEPATLTGSIGVVALKPALEEFYRRYGVKRVVVKSHPRADATTYHRHYTAAEREDVARMVKEARSCFVGIVAEARGMERERVEELATGFVFTGARARELGLVDELGGLDDAVAYARDQAGLDADAPVEYVGLGGSIWARLLGSTFTGASELGLY